MDFFRDFIGFLLKRKKFWLLPAIILLLVFGALIVLTSGTAIAPFIYTLFLKKGATHFFDNFRYFGLLS